MGVLTDKMLESGTRPKVAADCVTLVDQEVAAKKGITGVVIKTGYKAFKALKPTIVKEAVDHLLDDFVKVTDRHYAEFVESGGSSFESFAVSRDKQLADDLLGITDAIINKSNKATIKKIYQGLRKVAARNVAQAVPAIGRLVDKYMR